MMYKFYPMRIQLSSLTKAFTIVAFVFASLTLHAATLFENFDSPSVASTSNSAKDITYPSGVWNVCAITKPNTPTENDRINGVYSMRMRGLLNQNFMFMKFDKAGAGTLSFKYGSYSNHRGGEFTVQKSTDGGTNWSDLGSSPIIPVWSGTFLTYSVPVNYNGNIRFKIVVTLRTPNNANEQFNIDDFMVTDYGTTQVAMPTSSVSTGVYETPQTVTLSTSTPDATIYYTTDGSEPTTTSNVYTSPLNITQTTKIRMFAKATGAVDSREEVVLISFPELVPTLAEFYTKMAAAGTNLTYFKYTGEALVSFAYSTTSNKVLFFQDNTAGMIINDQNKMLASTYNTGDKITGIIAQVNRLNDSPQLYPYADFSVVSTGNTITPEVIALSDVPNRTNQLVRINGLNFTEANGTKTFSPNSPYIITDATTTSTTTTFRTPSMSTTLDYINTVIPATKSVVAVVAKNSSQVTTHVVFARSQADFIAAPTGIQKPSVLPLYVANGKVYFETSTSKEVNVYNTNGQKIKTFQSVVGKNNLELSKGIYVIKVGNQVAKIVL